MCGRYTLTYEEVTELEEFLYSAEADDLLKNHAGTSYANYNVAPSHHMPVACSDGDGRRMLTSMHWGFMGWKPKPGTKPFLPINTRDDSVTEKPMWKKAFSERRCIVPASGFYEWTGKKAAKPLITSIQSGTSLWVLPASIPIWLRMMPEPASPILSSPPPPTR